VFLLRVQPQQAKSSLHAIMGGEDNILLWRGTNLSNFLGGVGRKYS